MTWRDYIVVAMVSIKMAYPKTDMRWLSTVCTSNTPFQKHLLTLCCQTTPLKEVVDVYVKRESYDSGYVFYVVKSNACRQEIIHMAHFWASLTCSEGLGLLLGKSGVVIIQALGPLCVLGHHFILKSLLQLVVLQNKKADITHYLFSVHLNLYCLVTIALRHIITVLGEIFECLLSKREPIHVSTQNDSRLALIFIWVCVFMKCRVEIVGIFRGKIHFERKLVFLRVFSLGDYLQ